MAQQPSGDGQELHQKPHDSRFDVVEPLTQVIGGLHASFASADGFQLGANQFLKPVSFAFEIRD